MRIILAYIQIGVAIVWLIMDIAGIAVTAIILTGASYSKFTLMLATLIQGLLIGLYIWLLRDGIKTIKTIEG
jgi:hypothetical protein